MDLFDLVAYHPDPDQQRQGVALDPPTEKDLEEFLDRLQSLNQSSLPLQVESQETPSPPARSSSSPRPGRLERAES